MQVAKTILEQLGGNKFIAMTGAKNLVGSDNALSFRIGRNCEGINAVRIELTPMDTYTVTFYKVRKHVANIASQSEDVYCDMLAEIFTANTGMAVRL